MLWKVVNFRQFASVVVTTAAQRQLKSMLIISTLLSRRSTLRNVKMSDYAHVPGGSLKFKGGGEKWVTPVSEHVK